MRQVVFLLFVMVLSPSCPAPAGAQEIVHDAEYYILEAQHGERWKAEDAEIAAKLAEETWLVSLSAGTVLFPRVSCADDPAEIKDLTPRVCRSVLWITVAMSLILAGFRANGCH